jgi:colanic acid biosynthesis glycosyl transferase WcaI
LLRFSTIIEVIVVSYIYVMKILIYGINYSPELTGIGKYTGEMCSWLAQQGHEVDVITAMPYYPDWVIHPSYRGKWWFKEEIDEVNIYRCPVYVPAVTTSVKRILHELSFVISSLVYWLPIFFKKRYDVTICLTPPFHLGVLPVLYGKFRNVPMWCHVQDLQIDVAKELGMIKNRHFLNFMFAVERYILLNCSVTSTISDGMIRKITEKEGIQSDCVFFPNWVDDNYIKPLTKDQSLRAEIGLTYTDQVVLYSGNLGEKQGLEIIIEVAKTFISSLNVKFLIVGSGGGKDKLELLVKKSNLTNVLFYPLQPYEKLSALLATADIHLVLQKKSASDLVLPSKLTGILAAGGCALVSAVPGTTLYDVVEKNKLGILIEPESTEALRKAIGDAFESNLSSYRENARLYAKNNLSKDSILKKFECDLLTGINTK